MSTLKELIYNIRHELKDTSDDIKLSDRNIEFMINYLREKLIVQQLQKGRSISSNIKQDLGQVQISLIDKGEGTIAVGKKILRTVNKIPQPVELDQKDLFTYIGGLDKQSPFSYKTKSYATWNKHNKFASKLPIAYYNNGYIYIANCSNPDLKYINIEGVFSNPREVSKFTSDGTTFYNPDVDRYPISGRMIDQINTLIKKQELDLFYQLIEDSTNNASKED